MIGIIGSGIAGLAAAQVLAAAGQSVTLIDKGRGVGGRLATRRSDWGPFDHGAQYLTARDPDFVLQLKQWCNAGAAARWDARFVRGAPGALTPISAERYVGTPGMSAIAKQMATTLEAAPLPPQARGRSVLGERVTLISGTPGEWSLTTETGQSFGPFRRLIVTVPPDQAAPLLDAPAPGLAAIARSAVMAPCWAAMVAFDRPVPVDWDAADLTDSPLSWVARDSSKPGRPAGERWVLHGAPAWSAAHLEETTDQAAAALLAAFQDLTPTATPVALIGHRWRYAQPMPALAPEVRTEAGISLAGDWCQAPRVEGAWLSGVAAARAVLYSQDLIQQQPDLPT
jgi:hypothetical protein